MLETGLQSLPNLTVQQLEYLVAATDHPTRAAAAATLGVTPSALTQGLAELERRVGLPLFERHGRHTELRHQATEVLTHARRVVAETRDLARWAAAQRSGSAGVVRLGTIDAVAVQHRAEAIRAFHSNHPEVDLHLTVAPSGSLLEGLVGGDLDLIVCVEPVRASEGVAFTHCFDRESPCTSTPPKASSVVPHPSGARGSPSLLIHTPGRLSHPAWRTQEHRSTSLPSRISPRFSVRWCASAWAGRCCRRWLARQPVVEWLPPGRSRWPTAISWSVDAKGRRPIRQRTPWLSSSSGPEPAGDRHRGPVMAGSLSANQPGNGYGQSWPRPGHLSTGGTT